MKKATKKSTKPTEILAIVIRCPNTEEEVNVPLDSVSFSGYESPCEMCGSHGGVSIEIFECPSCKGRHKPTEVHSF
jgi:hypothetical protein